VGGVKLLERCPDSRFEGLLDEIPVPTLWNSYYYILNLPGVVREEWVVLNCPGTSWERY
jgi:hypothetical protein